ncbi:MAG TPA: cysteine--tRNA ligase [Euryarchaeota archaeon]|nr:cysteine--tRNA ligase [Euryarchaeota archaeon]
MSISIYNSLTHRKEEFRPVISGKAGVYVCGVTAYDDIHLGHARSAVVFDAVVRYLRYRGYEVSHVTNFTDVDDKIIARADELGMEPLRLSEMYIDRFFDEMSRLRVRRADHYPRASETIPDIISLIKKLEERGRAYRTDTGVYFDITKAEDYGKLSGQSLEQMQSGCRIDIDEDKRHPADFALWKGAKEGEISWPSPWGEGRPGWHIECSAMALKFIGETVDIHGGGTELIFPHHENEIQQSEAATGKPFVKYWMHNGLLMIDEEKMSKSLSNFFTVKEILARHDPSVVRLFLLNANYRQPLNYDEGSLAEAKRSLERLQSSFQELLGAEGNASGTDDAAELSKRAVAEFEEKMDDDFNTREALAAMFSLAREANRLLGQRALSNKGVENLKSAFERMDSVFDILKRDDMTEKVEGLEPKLIELILEIREMARKNRDFGTADAIRDGLRKLNIEVQDSSEGAKWKITR